MDQETCYLIDDIIRYSERKRVTLDTAATKLTELAKQRLPEFRIERENETQKTALLSEIRESGHLSLIIRVPMVTWIHEVHWRYFPKFHIVSNAREEYAFPCRLDIDTWPSSSSDKAIYLDDLFYDEEAERFWQNEPFLHDIPLSKRAYQHLKSKRLENLRGTGYRKIDPSIVSRAVKSSREQERDSQLFH